MIVVPARPAPPDHHTVPGTTIRFFISSTFADFEFERNFLQQRVFHALRDDCAAAGFRLQPIDLRWGVSEAAGIERQTLRICFDELERCRQLSPDFFLLILLGQRYGSYILPPQIPASLIARLTPYLTPDQRRAFEAAYRLDENAVPPEYTLLRADGAEHEEDGRLRTSLGDAARAAGVSAEDLLLFTGSATHREIQLGLLGQPAQGPGASGVLCALRGFAGGPRGGAVARFVEPAAESASALRQLTAAVRNRLTRDQMMEYDVAWRGDQGPVFDEDDLARRYLGFLRPKLASIIAARMAARAAAAARGRDAVALANAAFEADRAERVEGRDPELARLADYLAGKLGAGSPLLVTGAAGSGKSTVLAAAVKRAAATQLNAVHVTRYIGATPGTSNLRDLLNDLRRAITRAYGRPEPEPLTDENRLVSAVAMLLATLDAPAGRPLLLVLDALDQLGTNVQRTDWLPPRLSPRVRVVISVLADRPEVGYLRARLPGAQAIALAPLGRAAGLAMLDNLLAASPPRALTRDQRESVLTAFVASGLPLHLYLLAAEARRWRSFDPPPQASAPLPKTIPMLLRTMLERLEAPARNGRMLVARALGDLAAARLGLAEGELLDLLAKDKDVRDAQHALSPHSPPIDERLPLPVALWARLHADLAPLLTERDADGGARLYAFYHQQLRAEVEERYLAGAERAARHRALAQYLAGQSWRLAAGQWNWRKAEELVTQLERAGDRPAAERALSGLADEMEHEPPPRAHDASATIALVRALQDSLTTGGYWQVGQRLYTRQLAARRALGDKGGEAGSLIDLGGLAGRQGQLDRAALAFRQALDIARGIGDRSREGTCLNNLGLVAVGQGQSDLAGQYYRQALDIARGVADRAGELAALNNLGTLTRNQGNYDAASALYEQALALAREIGARANEGIALGNLGGVADDQGRGEVAARCYEQALAIAREIGDRAGEGNTLNNLGVLVGAQGRGAAAKGYYEQALAIYRDIGASEEVGIVEANLRRLAGQAPPPRWGLFGR